jgi:hypothetical protein
LAIAAPASAVNCCEGAAAVAASAGQLLLKRALRALNSGNTLRPTCCSNSQSEPSVVTSTRCHSAVGEVLVLAGDPTAAGGMDIQILLTRAQHPQQLAHALGQAVAAVAGQDTQIGEIDLTADPSRRLFRRSRRFILRSAGHDGGLQHSR